MEVDKKNSGQGAGENLVVPTSPLDVGTFIYNVIGIHLNEVVHSVHPDQGFFFSMAMI
jgi:hypothetical protein